MPEAYAAGRAEVFQFAGNTLLRTQAAVEDAIVLFLNRVLVPTSFF